eukprot:gene38250-50181_t
MEEESMEAVLTQTADIMEGNLWKRHWLFDNQGSIDSDQQVQVLASLSRLRIDMKQPEPYASITATIKGRKRNTAVLGKEREG